MTNQESHGEEFYLVCGLVDLNTKAIITPMKPLLFTPLYSRIS